MFTKSLLFICLLTLCFTKDSYANDKLQCPENELLHSCANLCVVKCATLGEPCVVPESAKCEPGCFCRYGRGRDDNGKCVPLDKCHEVNRKRKKQEIKKSILERDNNSTPKQCNKPNEVYACGSACQTECATLGKPCPIINITCNNDCYCKDGYARDFNGRCIPISTCPK